MPHWDWLIMAVFLAIGWLAPGLGERWFHSVESCFSRIAARRTLAIALIFFSTIALRLALLPVVPVPVPGIPDEFSYLLIGDTFAHGRLANPTHPLWVSFDSFHINMFPTYSSIYPPAQGFVLMLGQLLGHPWIGVLLSAAAMCAALVWMLQAWIPARWAFLGGVIAILKFGLVSYWINSYWGGAVAAVGGALVMGALGRIFRGPRTRDALLLGLGVAILANSRPYEGLMFCVPAAGAFLLWLKRPSSLSWGVKLRRIVLPVAACLVLTGAFIAYYNWRLTGEPLLMPHAMNRSAHNVRVFIWEPLKPPVHYRNRQFENLYNLLFRNYYRGTWEDLQRITADKVKLYNQVFLWLGAVPLFFCLPLTFGDRHKRLLLVELVVSILGFFSVVWFYPHYQAPALCVLYALLIQTLRHIRTLFFNGRPVGRGLSRAVFLLLLISVGMAMANRFAKPSIGFWNSDTGNLDRARIAENLRQTPGKHLVLVRYGRVHNIHEEWVYNGADIDGSKVVWARELDPQQNQKLLAYFHDRKVWLAQPEELDHMLSPYTPPQTSPQDTP